MNKPVSSERDFLLKALAEKYEAALLRYFRKRAPVGVDPKDLVQEVFLRLSRQQNLSEVERVEGYLFQIASSVMTDLFRRRSVRMSALHDSFDEDFHGMAGITPERVLISKNQVQHLVDALQELPERTRAVFILHHFESVRQTEISERLGISLRTVERHMAAALSHILERLS